MKKNIIILFSASLFFIGCKKEKPRLMINATVYYEDTREMANIAFLNSDQTSIIKNENTVDAYFKSLTYSSSNHQKVTDQFRGYYAPGEYIILIQLVENPVYPSRNKKYTYRKINISLGNPSQENVMVFKSGMPDYYQPWNNKY